MYFAGEIVRFLAARRRLWMLPICVLLCAIGGALFITEGSVLAPFIYTLF